MSQEKCLDIENDVLWLDQSHIHMKNPHKVKEKINNIIKGGKEKLQIIFDFDRTLTKHHDESGVPTKSSIGILESVPFVPQGFTEQSQSLLKKYFPIETDPNMSVEQKIPHMVKWWNEGLDLLKGLRWDPVEIDEFISQNQQPFRVGTAECLQQLNDCNVPVLVFSAGIGDVVMSCLEHQGFLTPNVHVVSNFLKIYDGKIAGYIGDIIHVFNKDEHMLQNTPYYEELTGRSNVILLGDSTGDARMAEGVPHDIILKIGFLNTGIEESLPQYKELFDIVLVDDQTMDVLRNILNLSLS